MVLRWRLRALPNVLTQATHRSSRKQSRATTLCRRGDSPAPPRVATLLSASGEKRKRAIASLKRRCGTAVSGPTRGRLECQPIPWSASLDQDFAGGRRTRSVSAPYWLSAFYPGLVWSYSDAVPPVCTNASRAGSENGKEVHPKAIDLCRVPGGRRHKGTR